MARTSIENEIISVIIPSYKKFDYIYTAIDSVLIQNYSSIEIIIADDGSENFPKEALDNYLSDKSGNNIISIKIFSNPKNIGTVKNINTAIRKSKGEYIAILASDDRFYDDTVLQKIVNRLKLSKNGIITCRRIMCDEKLNPIRFMPTNGHINMINKMNSVRKQHSAFIRGEYYEMASGSCTYYTRERLFLDNLFDEKFCLLEDWTHYIQITRSYMIETAYDIISIFYRSGGISNSISPTIKEDYIKILKEEIENNKKNISLFDYRYLRFNYVRFTNNSLYKPVIMFPDAFISRLIYKLRCKNYDKQGHNEWIGDKL